MPQQFAGAHLEPHDRPAFLARVADKGLDPQSAFQKDLNLVRVKGFKLVFEHGMTLLGSRQDLEERVRLPSAETVGSEVRIFDTVKRIGGR